MRKYLIILVTLLLISCKKECNIPINHLDGKIKSIKITSGLPPYALYYTYKLDYDSLSYKLNKAELHLKIRDEDTTYFLGQYEIVYNSNNFIVKKIGLDNINPYHKYKCYLNNNTISKINELDTITNDESYYFGYTFSTKIDTVYEPNVFPTALNRICYDYVFDGNNYSEFKFEYDYFNSPFGGALTHVKDTAIITYTNLPFNKYAPIQNMYSSSSLFNVGVPGEVIYDFIYLLGFEDYYFYSHNRNLIKEINQFNIEYNFNTRNQLSKAIINHSPSESTFIVYDYEYY